MKTKNKILFILLLFFLFIFIKTDLSYSYVGNLQDYIDIVEDNLLDDYYTDFILADFSNNYNRVMVYVFNPADGIPCVCSKSNPSNTPTTMNDTVLYFAIHSPNSSMTAKIGGIALPDYINVSSSSVNTFSPKVAGDYNLVSVPRHLSTSFLFYS